MSTQLGSAAATLKKVVFNKSMSSFNMDSHMTFVVMGKPTNGSTDPKLRYVASPGFVIYDGFTVDDSCYQMSFQDPPAGLTPTIVSEQYGL